MYSHVFSCILMYSHVFACIVMYRSYVSVMYGLGPDFPQTWGMYSPKCILLYFVVFLQYFDVSEQSRVSVRIEEAFQRYTQKKTDTCHKKIPGIGHVSARRYITL